MGDPKKHRRKYSNPRHPWQKERIDEEKQISKDYGLKRKNEIWKVSSQLKRYYDQAKELIASTKDTADHDRGVFLKKLNSLGLLKEDSQLTDVLGLQLKDLMERRLQTLVVRKNLARSMDQARQFIVHEHIKVGDNKITTPSYVVGVGEEATIQYADDSAFTSASHPELNAGKEEAKEKSAEKAEEKPEASEEKAEEKSEAKEEVKEESKAEEKEPAQESEEKPAEKEEASEENAEEKKE